MTGSIKPGTHPATPGPRAYPSQSHGHCSASRFLRLGTAMGVMAFVGDATGRDGNLEVVGTAGSNLA